MLQRDRTTGIPLVPQGMKGIEVAGREEFDWIFNTPGNPPSGIGAIDWNKILETSINTTAEVVKSRFGGPRPGQYFQNGSQVAYNLPQGGPTLSTFPGAGVAFPSLSGATGLLLLGVVALLAFKR